MMHNAHVSLLLNIVIDAYRAYFRTKPENITLQDLPGKLKSIHPEIGKEFINVMDNLEALTDIDQEMAQIYGVCKGFVRRYQEYSGPGAARIGLVYAFVKQGLHGVLSAQPFLELEAEALLRALLENAIRAARAEALFQVIGLQELTSVLAAIEGTTSENGRTGFSDKALRLNELLLHKGKGDFYDVPKFAEALIRIARSSLNEQVILRFDDDVELQRIGLEKLLFRIAPQKEKDKASPDCSQGAAGKNPMYLSGSYEYHEITRETLCRHYLDDFAVRFHYLIEPVAGERYCWSLERDSNSLNSVKFVRTPSDSGESFTISPRCVEAFLHAFWLVEGVNSSDAQHKDCLNSNRLGRLSHELANIGRQLDEYTKGYVPEVWPDTIKDGEACNRQFSTFNHTTHLIDRFPISGAGLFISAEIIEEYPPFTNAAKTTFIDDAIKWEMLKARYSCNLNSVLQEVDEDNMGKRSGREVTNFRQDRLGLDRGGEWMKDGSGEDKYVPLTRIKAKDIVWALNEYMPILLRGVLSYNLTAIEVGRIFALPEVEARRLFELKYDQMSQFLALNLDYQLMRWGHIFQDLDRRWPLNFFIDVRIGDDDFKKALVSDVLKTFEDYLDVKYQLWPRVVKLVKEVSRYQGDAALYGWLTRKPWVIDDVC
jgi:hypothetical protein